PSSTRGCTSGLRPHAAAIGATNSAASAAARARPIDLMAPVYHSVVTHTTPPALRVVTYNVHRCRGLDGRTRPERIAAVLRAVDADVVALQEVMGSGPHGGGHAEALGAALGMGWVMAEARQLRGHQFGNAVLSRFPITHHIEHDISWKTCEP